ncbi:hypothetical protein EG329_012020 [Mollisiaceae sp. DMI_Dod_QoI]|nr:hypothetical protein EG329_012020 [Helotiales sp. DMI_Dod_QoI]
MEALGFPLSSEVRLGLANAIRIQPHGQGFAVNDSYIQYYRRVVESNRIGNITGTHKEIINLIELLKAPNATRQSIITFLQTRLRDVDDEALEECMNLGVRLLLMLSIGSPRVGHSIAITGETHLDWKHESIRELISTRPRAERSITDQVKLEKIFNVKNLEYIGGIKVRWTTNLADHLRMRDDDTAVEIFHYVSFLRCHRNSPIFPEGLMDETLSTLALLLPEHNKDVKAWFKKQQKIVRKRRRLPLDPLARECGQLKKSERQIDKFVYWYDRLVILKQVFDEAEPSTIKQWWNDRRKKVQWYTFWVAALVLGLTILFGLIQCIEGAMQVYKAFNP